MSNNMYKEMTIEEAMKVCGRNTKVLVAVQDLEKRDEEVVFIQRRGEDCDTIFQDVKTVVSQMDDLVKQLRCFTVKQDIRNIQPRGVQKIVLLKDGI